MTKLLICGDSFAADWTVKVKGVGWVNLLEQDYKVTNLAQAGCSEYKILKQLQSVNVDNYDLVLVSHTSPFRLYVNEHPVHNKDKLHKNSCLLYSDVMEHLPNHPKLKPVAEYFEQYFDVEYAEHMHNLLLREIEEFCPQKTLHVSHIDWKHLHEFDNFINFKEVFTKHRGSVNHYTEEGNQIVYQSVVNRLRIMNE
jgi:hypothetical protein